MHTSKTGMAIRLMTFFGRLFGRPAASPAAKAEDIAPEKIADVYDPPANTLRGPAFAGAMPRHNFSGQIQSVSRMNVPSGRKARMVSPTGSSIRERPVRDAAPQKRQPAKRQVWLADRHVKPASAQIIPLPVAAKSTAREPAPRVRAA